jgi:hypothetical protein
MADLTNLPSKIVRAIRWYLVQGGVSTPERVYHTFDWRDRKFDGQPIVDVQMMPVGPDVKFTGDEEFLVEIQVKVQILPQPGAPNPEQPRIDFDAVVGEIRQLMMLSDQPGSNLIATLKLINAAAYTMSSALDNSPEGILFAESNADMNDFTIIKLTNEIYGRAKSEEVNCAVVQRFRVTACESKIDGYV